MTDTTNMTYMTDAKYMTYMTDVTDMIDVTVCYIRVHGFMQ